MRTSCLLAQQTLLSLTMVDPIEEQKRQDRLDEWYKKDGRDSKDHPMRCLYTGLADKYMNKDQKNA